MTNRNPANIQKLGLEDHQPGVSTQGAPMDRAPPHFFNSSPSPNSAGFKSMRWWVKQRAKVAWTNPVSLKAVGFLAASWTTCAFGFFFFFLSPVYNLNLVVGRVICIPSLLINNTKGSQGAELCYLNQAAILTRAPSRRRAQEEEERTVAFSKEAGLMPK